MNHPTYTTSLAERIADAVASQALGLPLSPEAQSLVQSSMARAAKVREAEIAAVSECPFTQFERLSGHRLR